jgi:hypothetical protein
LKFFLIFDEVMHGVARFLPKEGAGSMTSLELLVLP